MTKPLHLLFSLLILVPNPSFAIGMEDCFPSAGDVLEARREVVLRDEARVEVGRLKQGERVRITKVDIQASVQIWVRVLTQDQKEGWVFQGYWGDVIHGRAAFCPGL